MTSQELTMTQHDVALVDSAEEKTAISVAEWLEYYAPAAAAPQPTGERAPHKLDAIEQMFAYYD